MTAWLSKPEPRRKQKAREDRVWQARRRECETVVWERDRAQCRHCSRPLLRSACYAGDVGHVHEWPMRSSLNDGTIPALAFLLCPNCHLDGCHGWPRLVPEYVDPARGAWGEIRWSWARSKVEWNERCRRGDQ